MEIIRVRDWGESLGSRALGTQIRKEVASHLEQGQTVRLDFTEVRLASPSFVDELVGKLFLQRAEAELKQKLKITGAPPEIRALVRRMISERLKQKEAEAMRPKSDGQNNLGTSRLLPKVGNLLSPGYNLGGKLYVSHISFPPSITRADSLKAEISRPMPLPPREKDAHKGGLRQDAVHRGCRATVLPFPGPARVRSALSSHPSHTSPGN